MDNPYAAPAESPSLPSYDKWKPAIWLVWGWNLHAFFMAGMELIAYGLNRSPMPGWLRVIVDLLN